MAKNVQLKDLQETGVLHPETNVDQVIGLQDELDKLASGADLTDLEGRVTTLEDDTIPALETRVETLEGDLENKIKGVQSELKDYADEAANAIKDAILGEDVSAAFDTLKEVEEWITTHGNQAAQLISGLQGHQDVLIGHQTALEGHQDALEGLQSDVETAIGGVQTAAQGVQSQFSGVQTTLETTISGVQSDLNGVQTAAAGVQSQFEGVQSVLEAALAVLEGRVKSLEDAPKSNVKAVDIVDIP